MTTVGSERKSGRPPRATLLLQQDLWEDCSARLNDSKSKGKTILAYPSKPSFLYTRSSTERRLPLGHAARCDAECRMATMKVWPQTNDQNLVILRTCPRRWVLTSC